MRSATGFRSNSLGELRARLHTAHPHLAQLDSIAKADPADPAALAQAAGPLHSEPFVNPIVDFYLTNPIARASAVMAECSALAANAYRDAAE